MTIPSIVFGLLFSCIYGTLFHLWKDGGIGYLFFYLLLSNAGFWGGHFLAAIMNWRFLSVGPLNFGLATFFSIIFIIVGNWLSKVNVA